MTAADNGEGIQKVTDVDTYIYGRTVDADVRMLLEVNWARELCLKFKKRSPG